ncbi:Uncharacterized protein BM_BM8581 [Brugia malayi]|uniref:Bm8581, isoform a n=1 Tax=Brugia malayi TaxID=6279 RepID=A0A1P6CEM6_BRUMA|nr:Uncharacterized protein BM_BM8581 [Brugia malayi]CDP91595.1 Bm8581, isoform a [Brugia malayi]VIO88033.1 Uncharacterized protein BM_BM8581 [Brugia malayi]
MEELLADGLLEETSGKYNGSSRNKLANVESLSWLAYIRNATQRKIVLDTTSLVASKIVLSGPNTSSQIARYMYYDVPGNGTDQPNRIHFHIRLS